MKSRNSVDPELHVLRSAIRSLEGRARQELESARFGLFTAFEAGDAELARRWLRALRVGLVCLDRPDVRGMVEQSLAEIADAIEVRP